MEHLIKFEAYLEGKCDQIEKFVLVKLTKMSRLNILAAREIAAFYDKATKMSSEQLKEDYKNVTDV